MSRVRFAHAWLALLAVRFAHAWLALLAVRFAHAWLALLAVRFAHAWLALLAVLALLAGAHAHAHAQEQSYVHVVRAGDTLASVAQAYYGDPRRDVVLLAENGLAESDAPLLEGMRLVIPVVRYHRVARGESFRTIAERYYGDPNRAVVLLKANEAKPSAALEEGAQLLVPYPMRYVVHGHDTFQSIAARYCGGRDDGRLLRAFNGGRAKIARGQRLLVPVFDLVLSPQGLARVESVSPSPPSGGELSRIQAEVTRDLPLLDEQVRSGHFVEAAALGNQLLGRGQLTGNQELSVLRKLATAYVALDREDLAIAAFSRALAKQPDLELDSVRTSPRVLAALEAAKRQRPR